jgi:DNA-binding transcriptional LysR family regulator
MCVAGTNEWVGVLQELVTFVQVVESGGFSATARRLGQTPSAVSRQVARLERTLGVQLLHRSTRLVQPTEAGLEVFAQGRQVVAAAQAALEVAEGHQRLPQGLVRISAPKAFARHVLHPHLLAFMAQHPAVDVHLVVTDRDVDPVREGVDLAVRLTEQPPLHLVARPLMPVRQILVASPAYLAPRPAIAAPHDLLLHDCLALGELERDNRWHLQRGADHVELSVKGRYTTNHSELRLDAACTGLGVACVPDFLARPAVLAGTVVPVLPDWKVQANYQGLAYLLFAPTRHKVPRVRVLIDHLLQALADPGAPGRAPQPPV